MSANTPIIPPGSPLRGTRADRNSKLIFAVSTILAVHVVLLAGLLIQGCKKEDGNTGSNQETANNSLPTLGSTSTDSLSPTAHNRSTAPVDSSVAQSAPLASPPPLPNASPTATLPSAAPAASEPAPTSSVAATPMAPSAPTPHAHNEPGTKVAALAGTNTVTYIVKAGDTLTKIAKANGASIQAIREANNLKTDRLLVGKKLKVPQGSAPAATAEKTTPTAAATKPAAH